MSLTGPVMKQTSMMFRDKSRQAQKDQPVPSRLCAVTYVLVILSYRRSKLHKLQDKGHPEDNTPPMAFLMARVVQLGLLMVENIVQAALKSLEVDVAGWRTPVDSHTSSGTLDHRLSAGRNKSWAPAVEAESPGPNPSSAQLRRDIQFTGLTSMQDKFNPDRILCLFNSVMVSSHVIEMVFFHTEGMASVIGVGLPFSKVIMRPKSEIVVQEMPEPSWAKLWMRSYEGPFKPLTFQKCRLGVEGRSHNGIRQSTRGESNSNSMTNLRAGWTRWFDQLLDDLKALKISEMKNVGKEHGGDFANTFVESGTSTSKSDGETVRITSDHDEGTTSSIRKEVSAGVGESAETVQRTEDAMDIQKIVSRDGESAETSQRAKDKMNIAGNVSTEDKIDIEEKVSTAQDKMDIEEKVSRVDRKMVVKIHIYTLDSHNKLYNDEQSNVTCDPSKDLVLKECRIRPFLIVEFSGKTIANVTSPWAQYVTVRLKVDYQIDGNLKDPLKFGWYQNDLRFSFGCKAEDAAIIDDEEVKHAEEREMKFTSNKGGSQSVRREYHGTIKVGGGLPHRVFRGEGITGTSKESREESSTSHQREQVDSMHCLGGKSFSINKVSTGSKTKWEAFKVGSISPSSMWDDNERSIAKTTGLFSTVTLEAIGRWRLIGGGFQVHEFVAKRDLIQHTRAWESTVKSSKAFWKKMIPPRKSTVPAESQQDSIKTLTQVYSRDFMFNHSFSCQSLQSFNTTEPYEWPTDPESELAELIREPEKPPSEQMGEAEILQAVIKDPEQPLGASESGSEQMRQAAVTPELIEKSRGMRIDWKRVREAFSRQKLRRTSSEGRELLDRNE